MGAITSTSAMRSLPGPQAAGPAAGPAAGTASLLQTFQAHVEDMRNLVLCKICIKPLYEPYTLGCGHTYCYSCLTSWFGGAPNRRKRKNCPDCRAAVAVQPSPNYLLRDLVHMFISRVELLPEDETTAEHDEAKRIEAQLIEADRTTRTDGEPGLFKGAFSKARVQLYRPIHDEEDGVLRCPRCAWEMEDGECGQCGYADTGFSDGEDYDTMGTPSVVSIASSPTDQFDEHYYYNHLMDGQPDHVRNDFSEWVRRDQAARRARRAARQNGLGRQDRATTVDTEAVEAELRHRYQDRPSWHIDGEDDEEMAAFMERRPYDEQRWNTDTAETVDEDEEMSSAIEDEDDESTTSFHRAAILARDQGMYPPFESDLSTNGEMETVTNGSNSSDGSTESDDGSDTTEPTPVVQRLANRPARIVIDSDDESSSDSSSEEEQEEEEEASGASNEEEEETEESSDDDSTPSPPRPAAVRRARVEMHRGRRGIRGGGRGGSRGRPRAGN